MRAPRAEASFAKFIATKVFEPAYNFRGIAPRRTRNSVLSVSGTLGWYVLGTLWYGVSLLCVFEGLGLAARGTAPAKREA